MLLSLIKEKFEILTPAQKKAAHYIQANIEEAASSTAKEIGARSGCSEPTIHRLAKALGYQNYLELSKSMQEMALEKRVMRRFNALLANDQSAQSKWIEEHIAIEVNNVEETLNKVDSEKITATAQTILHAERVYIAGWRAGLSVTSFLAYLLHYILGNTRLIPQGEAAEYANYINSQDLLIVTGFPRYCKTTIQVCEIAKQNGAKIISFTDSELSPFYQFSDIAYIAKTNTRGMIDSYVAPLSLVNLIVNEVAYQKPEFVRKNITNMEQSLKHFDLEYTWK